MSKIKLLILPLILIALITVFAACADNSLSEEKLYELGFVNRVVLDCNGGRMDDYEIRTMFAPNGGKLLEPGKISSQLSPVRRGEEFDLEGWFEGTKDADGNITYTRKWDFENDLVNSDMTLYAKWAKKLSFVLKYGEEDGEFDEERHLGYVSTLIPQSERTLSRPTNAPSLTGHTFVEYYLDSELTQMVQFPLVHDGSIDSDDGVKVIYGKYIEGNYRVIRRKEDFTNISSNTNLYFITDIDMQGRSWYTLTSYSGTIRGNGHTISNLTYTVTQNRNHQNNGLFNELRGATLDDIHFVNCSVNITLQANQTFPLVYAGFFAGMVDSATTFNNVTLSGYFTLNIPDNFDENILRITDDRLFGQVLNDDLAGFTGTILQPEQD